MCNNRKENVDIRIKQFLVALVFSIVATAVPLTQASAVNQPKPKEYIVQEGDYLELIAQKNGIDWPKIWNKNLDIGNPDLIMVGQKLVIPTPEEVVPARTLPTQTPQTLSQTLFRGSGGPNGYDYGQCTWYVKNKRPDVGGYWGDANQWISSARSAGYSIGSQPVPGAIAVSNESSWGHVAYVESVNGNSVTVSEMNVQGVGVISTRTVSASFFTYIY